MEKKSEFTGTAAESIGYTILMFLGSMCTCGIAYPWLRCWYLHWVYEHSYINGKQLRFDGKGTELFGHYIIWWILGTVTCGIYTIVWLPVNMLRWETQNIHFADDSNVSSIPSAPPNYMPNQAPPNMPIMGGAGGYQNQPQQPQNALPTPGPQVPQVAKQDEYTIQKSVAKPAGQKQVQMYIALAGRQMTQNVLIQGSLVIGRDQSSNLYFPDNQMSRQHFMLVVEQDNIFIRDLGTTNGTFLNNRRITEQSRVMPGDKISAGQTQFMLRW